MLRTHTCGQLNENNIGEEVILSGWVSKIRHLGSMGFIDLRDKFGITQLSFNEEVNADLLAQIKNIGREFVLSAKGTVVERSSKNPNIPTGNIEINVTELSILNASETPPFTIEDETDGGEEIRMKYRYLDIRRKPVLKGLQLRHNASKSIRNFLDGQKFMEVETPVLIKSTPEGARDFVVPSRMNEGQFYALPQSPQTFKQLLMIGGVDRYYQIVKCFRDEDLRADRQPEFTQIDCEMSFVERDDVLEVFEQMICQLWKDVKNIELEQPFPRMSYDDSMFHYGNDKPDMRFGMTLKYITPLAQGKNFGIFDNAEAVLAINVEGGNNFTRKQLDKLTDFVKREQIGAKGMIWCRHNEDGTYKSSVDKFFNQEHLSEWAKACDSEPGDVILVMSGELEKTQKQMSELRLEIAKQLNMTKKDDFKPVWILDFPLLEFDEDSNTYHAMHHPFTSPIAADMDKLQSEPQNIKANAYDLAMNGVELGGGSIRIFDETIQHQMFKALGMSHEESREKFGFLLDAFKYGAPPHGGIAFGFDRLCTMLGGSDSIRDYIAFPKNNQGRDVMIDAPSMIDDVQRKELGL